MKIGMIIILWFCLTGGLVVAQEKRAYTLFDADGQETDYAHMMSVLGEQQVVFIGEIHNCPIDIGWNMRLSGIYMLFIKIG